MIIRQNLTKLQLSLCALINQDELELSGQIKVYFFCLLGLSQIQGNERNDSHLSPTLNRHINLVSYSN